MWIVPPKKLHYTRLPHLLMHRTQVMNVTMRSKRQACDRCHSQKLRCSRQVSTDNDGELCTRCFQQGAECVYGTRLPKGRRKRYGLAPLSTIDDAARTKGTSGLTGSGSADMSNCLISPESMVDNSTMVDADEQHSAYSSLTSFGMDIDPGPSVDFETGPMSFFPGPVPADAADWLCKQPEFCLSPGHIRTVPLAGSMLATTNTIGTVKKASPTSSSSVAQECITPLSELLTSLTSTWTEAQQHEHHSLIGLDHWISHAAVDLVAASLIPANTLLRSDTSASTASPLRDNILASQRLKEILQVPHIATAHSNHPSQSTGSNTVVHHLIFACYSLLLHIYDILFAAMHRDATLGQSSRDLNGLLAQSLAETRLFLIVRLSSDSIDSLHRSVVRYLASCGDDLSTAPTSPQTIINLEAQVQQRLERLRQILLARA